MTRTPTSLVLLASTLLTVSAVGTAQVGDANHRAAPWTRATSAMPPAAPGGPIAGGSWSDDFNRPDSSDMGPDWTEQTGDLAIASMHGRGNMSSGWSYMTHDAASASYDEAVMQIDLLPPGGTSGPHVALIMGVTPGSTDWLYTKLQDNDSNGTYDIIFFYSQGNGGGWGGVTQTLTTPISSGRVQMYVTGGGDVLNVDIDEDMDGSVDQHYENAGITGLAFSLGDGYGVGTWAMGAFDNWSVGGGNVGTVLCFGDGSGAPCGCGNESAPGAGGCLNSLGAAALLNASGAPDTTADTMSLTCSGVRAQPGLFFQGDNTIGGGAGTPFGDGVRCCGQNVVRIQVVVPPTPEPATAQMTETATTNGPAGTVSPGDTKCYQYWYRDPGGSPCGSSFNLSNAVRITWS